MNKFVFYIIYTLSLLSIDLKCFGSELRLPEFEQQYESLKQILRTNSTSEDYAELFNQLDKIELLHGYCIRIEFPEESRPGDTSKIFVSSRSGQRDNAYMHYVRLKEVSSESLWQWFLFSKIIDILPRNWPAHRKQQRLILTTESWIQTIKEEVRFLPDSIYDQTDELEVGIISKSEYNRMKEISISPLCIKLSTERNSAEIIFYTWNQWQGLFKHRYHLNIYLDNSVEIREHESELIVAYSCGMQ